MAQLSIKQEGTVTLNNVAHKVTSNRVVDVSQVYQTEFTCETGNDRKVLPLDKGAYGWGNLQFASITNLDSTNFLLLTIFVNSSTTDSYIFLKIPAGKTFVLGSNQAYTDQSSPASLADISNVWLKADTASVQAKIFMAY